MEGKEDFLRKIASTTGIQGANVIWSMKHLPPTACDFFVCKDYKIYLPWIYLYNKYNQLHYPRLLIRPVFLLYSSWALDYVFSHQLLAAF